MMNYIFSSPSLDDLIRLFKAWRFWILGAIIGSLIGAALYFIAPPPYRAHATVNVDFNLEEASLTNDDRQDFYYLERETRKMIEIAWSDEVLNQLLIFSAEELHFSLNELRDEKLHLSQPVEAGWNFYADDEDPQIAAVLASSWANAFAEKIQKEVEKGNINSFVRIEVTQSFALPTERVNPPRVLPTERNIPLSSYLLTGSSLFLLLAVFVILFVKPK